MTKTTKLTLSALVVGVLAGVSALGVFGLFTATTQNAGNEISTGTVALSDNDGGSAMINATGAKPGQSWTGCLKVTYNGSLPASVHGWAQDVTGALGPYLNVKIVQGTATTLAFPDCGDFAPDSVGTVYDGPLLGVVASDYEHAAPINPAGQTQWNPGDSVVRQFTVTLSSSAPDSAQGASSGVFSIRYEARNGG